VSGGLVGRTRIAIGWLAAIVVLVAFSLTLGRASFQPKTFEFDLMAFYCGGQVVAEGGDPYVVEPLGACEHAIGPIFRRGTKLVIPVPLPAYDFAVLAAVSKVPYSIVRVGWIALEILACSLSAFLLARLTRLRFSIVAASLVVSDFYCSTLLGQLASFSILGIVLCGWALEREKRIALFAGTTLAMIEPHLGLPIVAAIFIWSGRFRSIVALGIASLAALSLAVMPISWIVDYIADVLPAQALSEVNNQDQLSSLYAFHLLGLPETFALLLAKLNYALALAAGIAFARGASRTFGAAMLAFAPVLFVLVGGPYLHVTQVAAALPAALLVSGRSRSLWARSAVALLTIPWLNFVSIVTVLPGAAGALFVVLRKLCDLSVVRTVVLVVVAVAAETLAAFVVAQAPQAGAPVYGAVGSTTLPEATWRAIIDVQGHGHMFLSSLAKIPTLVGVLAIVVAIVRERERGSVPATTLQPIAQGSSSFCRP
jgi:hypothetical protein